MKNMLRYYLSDPVTACGAVFLVSIFALVSAYTAEYAFGLEPCILCLYQRWPYYIAVLLSIGGLSLLYNEEWIVFSPIIMAACAVVFFANAALAFYHVGVEQHWWKSAIEGCAVSFEPGSMDEIMALFDNKPAARCDEVPWSFLGISMAGFNAMLCLVMAGLSGFSAMVLRERFSGSQDL